MECVQTRTGIRRTLRYGRVTSRFDAAAGAECQAPLDNATGTGTPGARRRSKDFTILPPVRALRSSPCKNPCAPGQYQPAPSPAGQRAITRECAGSFVEPAPLGPAQKRRQIILALHGVLVAEIDE